MAIWGIIIYVLIIVAAIGFAAIAVGRMALLCFLPLLYGGAFFAKSREKTIQNMMELANLKKGQKVIDLGSGDGKLVVALASALGGPASGGKAEAQAYGYEISPYLVWVSKRNLKKAGLADKAVILRKNFWKEDLSQFDIIFLFGIKHIMKNLEEKLQKELRTGAKVISNYFIFPNWKYLDKKDDVYLYIK